MLRFVIFWFPGIFLFVFNLNAFFELIAKKWEWKWPYAAWLHENDCFLHPGAAGHSIGINGHLGSGIFHLLEPCLLAMNCLSNTLLQYSLQKLATATIVCWWVYAEDYIFVLNFCWYSLQLLEVWRSRWCTPCFRIGAR